MDHVPDEILSHHVFPYLSIYELILSASMVSKRFRRLCPGSVRALNLLPNLAPSPRFLAKAETFLDHPLLKYVDLKLIEEIGLPAYRNKLPLLSLLLDLPHLTSINLSSPPYTLHNDVTPTESIFQHKGIRHLKTSWEGLSYVAPLVDLSKLESLDCPRPVQIAVPPNITPFQGLASTLTRLHIESYHPHICALPNLRDVALIFSQKDDMVHFFTHFNAPIHSLDFTCELGSQRADRCKISFSIPLDLNRFAPTLRRLSIAISSSDQFGPNQLDSLALESFSYRGDLADLFSSGQNLLPLSEKTLIELNFRAPIEYFTNIIAITESAAWTGEAYKQARRFMNLKELSFESLHYQFQTFADFSLDFPALERFKMRPAPMNSLTPPLGVLRHSGLRSLRLTSFRIHATHFPMIGAMEHLEEIALIEVALGGVEEQGLGALFGLRHLTTLTCTPTPDARLVFTNRQLLDLLAQLPSLKRLQLGPVDLSVQAAARARPLLDSLEIIN